jgi:branched-chain amino acid transport system ATP-binding protein
MAMMLQVRNLVSAYGKTEVLHGISLSVEKAEIVGLIGANGAGKSTLLNTIVSLVPARSGQVILEGQEITRRTTRQIVELGVAQVPERRQLFGKMTVEENLLLGAYTRKGKKETVEIQKDLERIRQVFPILGERRNQLAESLSGGERQMLAIARAEMSRPRLWLLDEPSLGLAPLVVKQIMQSIKDIRKAGGTVLLIEQNADAALDVVDRAYVMETGRITLSGLAKQIKQDPRIQEAFLGQGERGEGLEQRIREISKKYPATQSRLGVVHPSSL